MSSDFNFTITFLGNVRIKPNFNTQFREEIANSQFLVNIRIQTFSFKMPWITNRFSDLTTGLHHG